MSGSLLARFRKTESDENNSDIDVVGKKEPPHRMTTVHIGPGGSSFDERASVHFFLHFILSQRRCVLRVDTAGGLGRHLGVTTCTLLIVGRIIGTGIFSTPSSILNGVGSIGASLMLWVLGFLLSFCGLFIWLEFGSMFPRSGGEKVYLEAVYTRPRYLATVVFAANAILLGFTATGCLVSVRFVWWVCGSLPVARRSLRASKRHRGIFYVVSVSTLF